MSLDLDTQWKIALEIPYRSLSSYCRSSSVARSICQAPGFWQAKTIHGFPKLISNRKEFEAIPERTDRLRYLNVYREVNDNDISETRGEIFSIDLHNLQIANPRKRFNRAISALQKELESYYEIADYIFQQRQERFRKYGEHLPVVHDWKRYDVIITPVRGLNDQPVYRYVDRNGKTVEIDVEDEPLVLSDVLKSMGNTMSLQDLIYIIMSANPDKEPPQDEVRPDDLILFDAGDFGSSYSNFYFVYQRSDGILDVTYTHEMPVQALDMFRRYDIHSQNDLVDLYGFGLQKIYEIQLRPDKSLLIARNEAEYNDPRFPGYYHASMLPELLAEYSVEP